ALTEPRTSSPSNPLLLINIGQLLNFRSSSGKPGPRRGRDLNDLGIIEKGAVMCLSVKIVSVGTTRDALRDPWLKRNRKRVNEVDCSGRVVLPGLVDWNTPPVLVT